MTAQAIAHSLGAHGNEARMFEMIAALPVAVYTTDHEGRLTYFNAAAAELSGRNPELGTDRWCITWKLFRPDGVPVSREECPMAIAIRGGDVEPGTEYLAERPDGSQFWFSPYPAVIRDGQGRITGGINILVDITSRKAAQLEAERAGILLGAIVDSSDDAIISKDLNGVIMSWNKSAERLFGYTAEEAVGKSITLLIPSDRLHEEPEILARVGRGERVDHFETLRRRKDGRLLDISLTISPVRNSHGKIIGASKIARDITAAKHAERGNQLLGAIVDSSDDAIISKDLNGIITSWNKSAERLFGYTADETIGKPITILIPADRQSEEPGILARLRRGERVDHFETRRVRKDGTLLDISVTISPVRDRNGIIIGASKVARDITEKKRIEAEIRRANKDLEQFAFSASHDLQEPLRTVKIFSELLSKRHSDKLDGESLEFLGYLRSAATRMESLVRDLLSYTRISKLEKPLRSEVTDANLALSTALANLAGGIAGSGAHVSSIHLPEVRMLAAHLHQLFQNLIGNAIKYRSPHRTPMVNISVQRQTGEWIFSVTDNGIGIAPEYKEQVFGLFKRLHTSDEYSGTGIGLAICQRIVDQYHGRIWVESEPGQGSSFRFSIPD